MANERDLFNLLNKLGIEFTLYRHASFFTVEESRQARENWPGGHCKCLFLKDKKANMVLAVVHEDLLFLMFAMIIFISTVFEDRWPEKISPTANRWFFASFFMGSMAVILVETSKLINLHGNYPLVFAYLPLVLIVFWFLNFFQSSLKKRPDSPSRKLKFSRGLLTYGLASLMIPFQMTGLFDTCRFSYLADNCHYAEESLYKNVRTITGNNSIFITPPNLVRFRLFTHRAVVASWDEVPFTPQETLEWYRRMSDIVGVEQISSWQEVNSFYQTQTVDNLIKLREKYGVDYAVFRNDGSFNPVVLETFGPPVYKNKVFFLFSLKKEQQIGE